MKRKHSVVVEITYSEPRPEKDAVKLVKQIMSSGYSELGFYGRSYKVKSFHRVYTALRRSSRRKNTQEPTP